MNKETKKKYPKGTNPNSLANLEKGKFKPGEVANPKGRTPSILARLEKSLAISFTVSLSREDKFRIIESLLELNIEQIQSLVKDPKTPLFVVSVASALAKDIRAGRIYTLDSIFDRFFGKAKQTTALIAGEKGEETPRFIVEIVTPKIKTE